MVRLQHIFREAFDTETTMLLILTNMFSTVTAAAHTCLKYFKKNKKKKQQVNEGVRGFISMVLMSTTPLMCNKQTSVGLQSGITIARAFMLCVMSVFMHMQ